MAGTLVQLSNWRRKASLIGQDSSPHPLATGFIASQIVRRCHLHTVLRQRGLFFEPCHPFHAILSLTRACQTISLKSNYSKHRYAQHAQDDIPTSDIMCPRPSLSSNLDHTTVTIAKRKAKLMVVVQFRGDRTRHNNK